VVDILSPSFRLRSCRRFCSRSSSSRAHGDELVNQLRLTLTDAWRGRTSAMWRWYCLRPSSRGADREVLEDRGSWVRAELENLRIRPVVICPGRKNQP
jgi:hypothetical protein